jgi:hypothetical protein
MNVGGGCRCATQPASASTTTPTNRNAHFMISDFAKKAGSKKSRIAGACPYDHYQ